MEIILKKENDQLVVLNVIYGENTGYIDTWIKNYIEETTSDYKLEKENDEYIVNRELKTIKKGFLYNTKFNSIEKLYTIFHLSFKKNIKHDLANKAEKNTLWNNINNDITNRVFKKLDKDSLYQIMMAYDTCIKSKNTWNATELVMLKNQLTSEYKKTLYSTIVRQVKNKKNKEKTFSKNKKLQIHPINPITDNAIGRDTLDIGSYVYETNPLKK